jgi:hypothetical protein
MARTFRFWFHLTLIVTLLALASQARAGDVSVRNDDGTPWTIRISPAIPASNPATGAPVLPPAPESTEVAINPAIPATTATVSQPDLAANDFGILIIPAKPKDVAVNGQAYEDVYRSIPYSLTEYLANPSYRHDAAMEVLFGALRPTTVHREVHAPVAQEPDWTPYRPYLNAQWDYFQTAPLLRPRYYAPLLPQGFYY